jgi:hypothetical protein
MKKIIAYSLWGDDEKYTLGAIKNAVVSEQLLPDWICRFYVGASVPQHILSQLEKKTNVELVRMEEQGNWTGMFWRFLSADSDDVMVSRDTDSRITQREVDAIEEWLSSDKDFHIMRDHPFHGTQILGGMWGCRNGILKGISEWVEDYTKGDFWQVDQNFLREVVYPKVQNNAIVHDEFFEKKPFPTKRKPREFVGQAFNGDNTECETKHGDMV